MALCTIGFSEEKVNGWEHVVDSLSMAKICQLRNKGFDNNSNRVAKESFEEGGYLDCIQLPHNCSTTHYCYISLSTLRLHEITAYPLRKHHHSLSLQLAQSICMASMI